MFEQFVETCWNRSVEVPGSMSQTQNKRPITDNLSTVAVLVRGIPASVDRVSAECIWKADWADLGRDLFETVLLLFRSKVNIRHVMSFIVFPCWKDERWWMHLIHRKHQNEGSLILGCLWLPMAAYGCLWLPRWTMTDGSDCLVGFAFICVPWHVPFEAFCNSWATQASWSHEAMVLGCE